MKERRRFKRAGDKKKSKFNRYKVSKEIFIGFDWVIFFLLSLPVFFVLWAFYIISKY